MNKPDQAAVPPTDRASPEGCRILDAEAKKTFGENRTIAGFLQPATPKSSNLTDSPETSNGSDQGLVSCHASDVGARSPSTPAVLHSEPKATSLAADCALPCAPQALQRTRHLLGDATPVRIAWPVAVDHPAFAGHFPGQPLLPGVAILSIVLEAARNVPALAAAAARPMNLAAAKFLSPVRPGSMLEIDLQAQTNGLRFEVACRGVVAAKGQWTWTPPG